MDLKGYAATIVASIVSGWFLRSTEFKPKLCYWFPHNFIYEITMPNGDPYIVQTSSITLQNLGRKGAEGIEIIHKTRPDHFQFFPSIKFEEETTGGGEHVIKVDNLGPKEFFTVQIISFISLPGTAPLLNIRSKEGPATQIPIQLQRLWPKWFNLTVAGFVLVGAGVTFYWILKGIIFIPKIVGEIIGK